MPISDWWQGVSEALSDPTSGGGVGRLSAGDAEYLKSILKVNDANERLGENIAAFGGSSIPNAPDQLPLSQTLSQVVAGGGQGKTFLDALNTTAGAGGFANLLGRVGAAISRPGSWQERLGKEGAAMGAGAVAADATNRAIEALNRSTPAAPNSNFLLAPALPAVLKNPWGAQ